MHIEHLAIWTRNLERLKTFYETYFQAHAAPRYVNTTKQFESCFLSFVSGARLELMQTPAVVDRSDDGEGPFRGYCHLAISVGSKEQVDSLTAKLRKDGYRVIDGPRWTGDGYYESRVLDCDGNPIEVTI
ncbi:MAG: VOC family protein [Chloroflexota bacterium]